MATPCCPNAGPSGGAGDASPAGKFTFMIVFTFFAIFFSSLCTGYRKGNRTKFSTNLFGYLPQINEVKSIIYKKNSFVNGNKKYNIII